MLQFMGSQRVDTTEQLNNKDDQTTMVTPPGTVFRVRRMVVTTLLTESSPAAQTLTESAWLTSDI